MKSGKIKLNLSLIAHNNISKFGLIQTQVTEWKQILQFHTSQRDITLEHQVKSVKIKLNLPLVAHNNTSKFGLIWLSQTQVTEWKHKYYNFILHKGT